MNPRVMTTQQLERISHLANFLRWSYRQNSGISPISDLKWEAIVCYYLAHGENLEEAEKLADQNFEGKKD